MALLSYWSVDCCLWSKLSSGVMAAGLIIMGPTVFGQTTKVPSITGTVVANDITPISGAKVIVHLVDTERVTMLNITTENNGTFEISRLSPGVYKLHAVKNDDGFGDADFAIFAFDQPSGPVISVKDNHTATVTIQLGEPMRRVSVDVGDRDTTEPFEKSRFRLAEADKPEIFLSSNPGAAGHFTSPIPPGPVRVGLRKVSEPLPP